ncbi:MAG: restriction endonuclease subunit S [Sphingobacterium sp.]|jgi:type I restriction enzyme S subunit|nr:restriction endonuclease subunit S [Sphingobacterium sp.]
MSEKIHTGKKIGNVPNRGKSNIPRLRFPEFTGEWEVKKLGEIADKVNSGKTPLGGEAVYTKEGVLFIRSQNVNNDGLELDNSVFIPESVNNQMKNSIVRSNDILLNITGASLGRSCVVPEDFKMGNVNQHVCIIRLKQNYNPRFVQPILSSYKGQSIFNSLQTGSGREGLNFESIKGIKLSIPQKNEQVKIGNLLSLIDNRISTQSKIINDLRTLKSATAKKIFSQELRFKDDMRNDYPKWNIRNIGDICEVIGGGTPETNKVEYWNGNIQWFTPTEIKSNFVSKSERTISELGLKNSSAKLLSKGAILLTTRATIGEASIALEECTTNQGFQSLITREECNNLFIFNWIKMNKYELEKRANGSTFSEISKSEIEKIEIHIPCFEEQTKIANFLSSFDSKIDIETQLLQKLEDQKKFVLQQMFV